MIMSLWQRSNFIVPPSPPVPSLPSPCPTKMGRINLLIPSNTAWILLMFSGRLLRFVTYVITAHATQTAHVVSVVKN